MTGVQKFNRNPSEMKEEALNEVARLRAALQPFAALGGPDPTMVRAFPDLPEDTVIYQNSGKAFTVGDVRRARVALGLTRLTAPPPTAGQR